MLVRFASIPKKPTAEHARYEPFARSVGETKGAGTLVMRRAKAAPQSKAATQHPQSSGE